LPTRAIPDLLDDGLVELGLLAGQLEADLLAAGGGEIADQAGEPREERPDRDHAHGQDPAMQLAGVAFQ
jgi:hypothetical protein